jgi:hypothetical protein
MTELSVGLAQELADERAIDRRVLLRVWAIGGVFLFAVTIINALTFMTEAERVGAPYDARLPWLLEGTSVVVLFLLIPAVAWFESRCPFAADTWPRMLGWHLLGSVAFAAAHIAGLWLLRILAFGALGQPYGFFTEPLTDILYEYRKDLLTYALFVLVLSLTRGIELAKREAAVARRDARETGRLTLKSGGRTIFLDAALLDWANAAGNYVEIRANGTTHLVRIGLAALEQQLREAKVPVARVHRSRLVNRDKVREVIPAGDGDIRIRMADGTELRGSRRYRAGLG